MVITKDEVTRYKSLLARRLEHWGVRPTTRDECTVTVATYPTERERWEAWCIDALWMALDDYESGQVKYAWRGILQAREYQGRGGRWPGGGLCHDVYVSLQNAVESVVFRDERALRLQLAADIIERDERDAAIRAACAAE